MIEFTVNGKPRRLDGPTPLEAFLKSIGVDLKPIAVALNGTVLRREELRSVMLSDGDAVEIVRAVGGG